MHAHADVLHISDSKKVDKRFTSVVYRFKAPSIIMFLRIITVFVTLLRVIY